MHQFTDALGNAQRVSIDVGTIMRVKNLCNVDLTKIFHDDMRQLAALFDDMIGLSEIIWTVVMPPSATLDDKVAFVSSMNGEILETAAHCLLDAIIDFFPNSRRRDLLRKAVGKLWESVAVTQDDLEQKLDAIAPKSFLSATSSLASPESTPAA